MDKNTKRIEKPTRKILSYLKHGKILGYEENGEREFEYILSNRNAKHLQVRDKIISKIEELGLIRLVKVNEDAGVINYEIVMTEKGNEFLNSLPAMTEELGHDKAHPAVNIRVTEKEIERYRRASIALGIPLCNQKMPNVGRFVRAAALVVSYLIEDERIKL